VAKAKIKSKKKAKKRSLFSYILYGFFIVVIVFSIALWAFKRYYSQDLKKLDISVSSAINFKAERDEQGVWQLVAPNPESMYFAFGYLQALDREFQVELMRFTALGRLAEFFGEGLIVHDRLHRTFAKSSETDWKDIAQNSLTRISSDHYVKGFRHYQKNRLKPLPLEMNLFLNNKQPSVEWQSWHLMAMHRLRAISFTFNHREEWRSHFLSNLLGDNLTKLLYGQIKEKSTYPLFEQSYAKKMKQIVEAIPTTQSLKNWPHHTSYGTKQSSLMPKGLEKKYPISDFWLQENAGSNTWMLSSPLSGRAATLCNDAHPSIAFPSFFYPIKYNLSKNYQGHEVQAQGFLLAGFPALMTGKVDLFKDKKIIHSYVAGITVASGVDSADYILLDKSNPLSTSQEVFKYKDEAGAMKEKTLVQRWSSYGPVLDDLSAQYKSGQQLIAFDWLALRKNKNAFDFFLQRGLKGAVDLKKEMDSWLFPPLQYSWIHNNYLEPSKSLNKFSFVLLGALFDKKDQKTFLKEAEASKRGFSLASQRPMLEWKNDATSEFLMVSANQKIWSSKKYEKIGSYWAPPWRANRIMSLKDSIMQKPESAFFDKKATFLQAFYAGIRKELNSNRLCAAVDTVDCQGLVASLDSWSGFAEADSWQSTVLNLWSFMFFKSLWPKHLNVESKEISKIFYKWINSSITRQKILELIENPSLIKAWQKESTEDFYEQVQVSFVESLALLTKSYGAKHERWLWKYFHRLDWLSPYRDLSAFESFRGSLLGLGNGMGGTSSSPYYFNTKWRPEFPLRMDAGSGAAYRFCAELSHPTKPKKSFAWTFLGGPSGNAFSKWAWHNFENYFIKERLFESK